MAETTSGGEVLFIFKGDASQLEAAIAQAKDAMSGLTEEAEDTNDGLIDIRTTAQKAEGALKGLARGGARGVGTALSAVNPAAGRLVRVFGSMAAMSGPLAIAVGTVGAALLAYKLHTDAAAAAAEAAAGRVEDLTRALNDQSDIAASVHDDFRLITGDIDALGLASERRAAKVQAAGDEVVAVIDRQIAAQEELIEAEENTREARLGVKDGVEALTAELTALKEARASAIANTENQLAEVAGIEMVKREMEESNETLRRRAELQREAAESARERGQAEADAAAAAQAAAAKAEADRLEGIGSRIEGVISSAQELGAQMSESMEQFNSDVEEGLDEAEKQIREQMEANQDGVRDTISGVASLSATLAENMAEGNDKAAKAIFKVSQAAALTEVAMSTAAAIMKAMAIAGPFMGPAVATGITATAAAQTAIILSQKPPAHMGDPMAPDETTTASGRRVLTSEAVLDSATTRRMGGEDGLRAAMRNEGPQPLNVTLSYKHLDREIARLMRSDSRTRRAIKGR